MSKRAKGTLWEGFWRLADPKISITSAAAMMVGGCVAAADGALSWLWLGITGAALFCVEVAKNAWGEVFDYDSGTDLAVEAEDRTDFSGGKRVLVDALLSRSQTWGMAFGFGATALVLGAVVVLLREPLAFWIGALGALLGWSYHGPPLRLAYRGLGELDVVLCYGPLIVLSTYLIQTGTLSWPAFWLSLPLGLLIAAFLWVNEFPDYLADAGAGKRNLVVRLGRRRASRVLPVIYVAAFAILPVLVGVGYPVQILLGMAATPSAFYACIRTWAQPDSFYRGNPVQPAALITFVIYSLGVSIGYLSGTNH
jgi:1,4-dihydroxy-2-naphthoate octaprenyltransferase